MVRLHRSPSFRMLRGRHRAAHSLHRGEKVFAGLRNAVLMNEHNS
jgi:hypothetical protein